MKNIKNYTSTVSATTSVSKIENRLLEIGARRFMKDYNDDGILTAIFFQAKMGELQATFRLPARVDACYKVLISQYKRPTKTSYKNARAQAERTAWKTIFDWVDAQCAMIQLQQAELAQVFLPYAFESNTGQTLYEKALEVGVNKLLPA